MKHLVLAIACLLATSALADRPRVTADIAPVHALVSRVMSGVGEPDLLLAPGQSPHTAAMRPSQARALQAADVVVWIGPELTPWMEKPVETLAGKAVHLDLLAVPGTTVRLYRDPDADDDHQDQDGEAGGDEHHHHSGTDPHAWLDPDNAQVWLGAIAAALSDFDPDNAAAYRANAAAGAEEIARLGDGIATRLAGAKGRKVATFHDAFQYFEARFGIVSAGTLTLGDAASPSPARVARLRDTLVDMDVTCVFAEPQFDARLLNAAAEGSRARVAVLDPLGIGLEPGAALYPQLLQALADNVADCLEK